MRLSTSIASLACAALLAGTAQAQQYPNRLITLVVPFAAASGTDQQARATGQALSDRYHVPVVVTNKVGASGFLAAQFVANAPPDGYTVLMTTNTTHAANQHLFRKIPYDPVKDFAPVSLLSKGHMFLVVGAQSPYRSVADLIAAAKKAPGKLNFGSGSSSSRVASELLKQLAGVDMVNVPYKSNPQAITDLMGGQVDFMFADAPTALPQIIGGRLRALAVSGDRRLATQPDVPTVAESGVPGYDLSYWTAAYLPKGTPPEIVDRLHDMLVAVASSPALTAFQANTSGETIGGTPRELAAFQASETEKWGRVIRNAHIEPE